MKEYQVSFTTKDTKPYTRPWQSWRKRQTYRKTKKHHLEDTMIMYGVYNSNTLTALIRTVHSMQNTTSWKERTFAGQLTTMYQLYLNEEGVHNYAINSALFLTTVREKYVKCMKDLLRN